MIIGRVYFKTSEIQNEGQGILFFYTPRSIYK